MAFADLLTKYRKRAGVTKTSLARAIGVTFTAVHAWESGKTPPPPERIKEIAKIVSVPKEEVGAFHCAAAMERAKPETAEIIGDLQRQLGRMRHAKEYIGEEAGLPVYRSIPDPEPARRPRKGGGIGEQPPAYQSAMPARFVLEVSEPLLAQTPERSLFPGDQVIVEKADASDPRPYDQRLCVVFLDGRPLLRQVRVQSSGKATVVMLRGGEGTEETVILGQGDFRIVGVVVRLISRAL
jgi:transcriptional regulator with XRE-family HTH domain